MNYIDTLAIAIAKAEDADYDPGPMDMPLYRIYALLALAKGEATTAEDVHDAWSAWQATAFGEHRSLIPFEQLTEEVQHYDDAYVDAIRAVARGQQRD